MTGIVKEITDSDFEQEVLNSDLTVIVDFWAPWCGPCKSLAPVLDDLAQQHDGQIKFCKVNIDNNPISPDKYGVRGIPNLIVFKEGQVHDQMTGFQSPEGVATFIERAL